FRHPVAGPHACIRSDAAGVEDDALPVDDVRQLEELGAVGVPAVDELCLPDRGAARGLAARGGFRGYVGVPAHPEARRLVARELHACALARRAHVRATVLAVELDVDA